MHETTADVAVMRNTAPAAVEDDPWQHDPDVPRGFGYAEPGRAAVELALLSHSQVYGSRFHPEDPRDPAAWHAVARDIRQEMKAAGRTSFLDDRLSEAECAWRYLTMWPMLPRPLLKFCGCPPARGCHRVNYWCGVPRGVSDDWLLFETWGSVRGRFVRDGASIGIGTQSWPAWGRAIAPVRDGWWPDYRDTMREQVYEAGRRTIGGQHWEADLDEIDDQARMWARGGEPVTGGMIEAFARSLDPVPAEPGAVAIAADPWAGHLEWVFKQFSGTSFTVAAMLSAMERDPDAVPVPGAGTGAMRTGKAYGQQAGKPHAGFELRQLPGAHGIHAWQVVTA